MKLEKLYRILSAILMPITFILAFFTLPVALLSLGNPYTLFSVFIFVCVVLYVVKSVGFFRRNILTDLPAKANVRDWVRVNAFVTIFYLLGIFSIVIVVFFLPKLALQVIQPMVNSLQDAQGTADVTISTADILHALRNGMVFYAIYGLLLVLHIILSFKLLKRYRYLFSL